MANCYIFLITSIFLIQIYGQGIFYKSANNAISLINNELVYQCVSQESILESYEYGYGVIELDLDLLVNVIDITLSTNYPNFDFDKKYYFYDSYTLKNCLINNVPCNSFQIKITVSYKDMSLTQEKRYEFTEKR